MGTRKNETKLLFSEINLKNEHKNLDQQLYFSRTVFWMAIIDVVSSHLYLSELL